MNCPICDRENAHGSKRCSHCGTKFGAFNASLRAQARTQKKKKRDLSQLKWGIVCLAVLLLVSTVIYVLPKPAPDPSVPMIQGSGITGSATIPNITPPPQTVPGPTNQVTIPPVSSTEHVSATHHIHVGTFADSFVSYDYDILNISSYGRIMYASEPSLDGSARALITVDGMLLLVHAGKITSIDSNVVNCKLSAMGTAVAYVKRIGFSNYQLCIYDSVKRQSYLISYMDLLPEYCISPDGESVAYCDYYKLYNTYTVWLWQDQQSRTVGVNPETPIAVSNGGSYIYTLSDGDLYCLNDDERDWLGNDAGNYLFSADHKQILFQQQGHTYICVDGENKVKFAPFPAEIILPANSISVTSYTTQGETRVTTPFYSFYDRPYYYRMTGTINYVSTNMDETYVLFKDPDEFYLDATGKTLFYSKDSVLSYTISEPFYMGKSSTFLDDDYRPGSFSSSSAPGFPIIYISGNNLKCKYLYSGGGMISLAVPLDGLTESEIVQCTIDTNGYIYYVRNEKLYGSDLQNIICICGDSVSTISTTPCGIVWAQVDDQPCLVLKNSLILTNPYISPAGTIAQ